jgi:hypothetical protein
MKYRFFSVILLLFLTACNGQQRIGTQAYEEFERMVEPTSTAGEDYRAYETDLPEEPPDQDGDGWTDNFDLCPQEASINGLAGCEPLSIQSSADKYALWYQFPIDPSGRINVFGDRLLVLTNYQLGEIQIYDLADGNNLRTLKIPDMLNDSPTLLPQGIVLKNYDQQRWRLLDYNGNEFFSAKEELEIINLQNDILISRADNTIFIRDINSMEKMINQIPGRYAKFTRNDTVLAITDPDSCTITLLDLNNSLDNQSLLFSPGSAICYQSAQFSEDGQYIFFAEEGTTHLISSTNPEEHFTYSGIPMGQFQQGFFLLNNNQLLQQLIPDGESTLLLDAGNAIIQKILLSPDQSTVAILSRNMETHQAAITFVSLSSHKIVASIEAEALQFTPDQFFTWSFGDEGIQYYDLATFSVVNQLQTLPISSVETAINQNLVLVSGQDQQLYVYGPEGE